MPKESKNKKQWILYFMGANSFWSIGTHFAQHISQWSSSYFDTPYKARDSAEDVAETLRF